MNAHDDQPQHFMLPGTHEWPRTPQCKCGKSWDWWNDKCTSEVQAGGAS